MQWHISRCRHWRVCLVFLTHSVYLSSIYFLWVTVNEMTKGTSDVHCTDITICKYNILQIGATLLTIMYIHVVTLLLLFKLFAEKFWSWSATDVMHFFAACWPLTKSSCLETDFKRAPGNGLVQFCCSFTYCRQLLDANTVSVCLCQFNSLLVWSVIAVTCPNVHTICYHLRSDFQSCMLWSIAGGVCMYITCKLLLC